MKKVFAVLAIASIMVACNNKKEDKKEGTGGDTTKTENKMSDTSNMNKMMPDSTKK